MRSPPTLPPPQNLERAPLLGNFFLMTNVWACHIDLRVHSLGLVNNFLYKQSDTLKLKREVHILDISWRFIVK